MVIEDVAWRAQESDAARIHSRSSKSLLEVPENQESSEKKSTLYDNAVFTRNPKPHWLAASGIAILLEMTDLTHVSFHAFVSTRRLAVILFWAAWNGYDVEVKEWLEQRVPMDLLDQIAFGRLDIDPPEN